MYNPKDLRPTVHEAKAFLLRFMESVEGNWRLEITDERFIVQPEGMKFTFNLWEGDLDVSGTFCMSYYPTEWQAQCERLVDACHTIIREQQG